MTVRSALRRRLGLAEAVIRGGFVVDASSFVCAIVKDDTGSAANRESPFDSLNEDGVSPAV